MAVCPVAGLSRRTQRPFISLFMKQFRKHFASSCDTPKKEKEDGPPEKECCGPREDCRHPPCKPEEIECYYATRTRYPCVPYVYKDRCDYNPCELWPLLDWLYYRISDKAKRQYQKTWRDCPPVMRKKCHYEDIPQFPPIERRSRKMRLELSCREPTACEKDKPRFLSICKMQKSKKSDKCPWMKAPSCPEALLRRPPCNRFRGLQDCPKPCCPFPAFSECCISAIANIPSRSAQCGCLGPPISWCHSTRIVSKLFAPPKKD